MNLETIITLTGISTLLICNLILPIIFYFKTYTQEESVMDPCKYARRYKKDKRYIYCKKRSCVCKKRKGCHCQYYTRAPIRTWFTRLKESFGIYN